MARAAVELIRGDAQGKGVVVELVLETELGVAVLDAHRLQQVLLNLLSNAVKYTQAGGQVTLGLRRRDGWLEADVADSGIGIDPALMPHLFERFRQGESGPAREHQGLGIGLALSRQLLELHGGSISAHSEGAGRGALFRLRLPWIDADAGAGDETRSALRLARPLTGTVALLVEDDASTRSALASTLAYAGATVAVAGSGAEALQLLESRRDGGLPPFDVVVSDLGLPGMSGFELIRHIAERARERGEVPLPACAVTAHARDIDRQRAIDAGFDMCLVKPVVPESLIEAVADLRDVATASA